MPEILKRLLSVSTLGPQLGCCNAAVLDDGLLDVAYVMNYPREQVPGLLKELMRGRDEGDELEVMDCFGSMRVKWLEVHCADGLQVQSTLGLTTMRQYPYIYTPACLLHVCLYIVFVSSMRIDWLEGCSADGLQV